MIEHDLRAAEDMPRRHQPQADPADFDRFAVGSSWKLPAQPGPSRAFIAAMVSGVASTAPWPGRAWSECACVMTARATARDGSTWNPPGTQQSPTESGLSQLSNASGGAMKEELEATSILIENMGIRLRIYRPRSPHRLVLVGLGGSGGFQGLPLGGAGYVETLEIAVLLVELVPHPHEQIVEGIGSEARAAGVPWLPGRGPTGRRDP